MLQRNSMSELFHTESLWFGSSTEPKYDG